MEHKPLVIPNQPFQSELVHLHTGDFLDGRITLVGSYIDEDTYVISFILTTIGQCTFEGSVQMKLSNYSTPEAIINKALYEIEKMYVDCVSDELAKEIKSGRLPH